MGKKIMIAVDYSENSARAAGFVAETFPSDMEVLIFSVVPRVTAACELDGETLAPHVTADQKAFCRIEDQKRMDLTAAIERAKKKFLSAGFSADKVKVKVAGQKKGIARDIADEAAKENPDLLVLGRRGHSGFSGFFLGSVSQKVLQLVKDRSVLLVQ